MGKDEYEMFGWLACFIVMFLAVMLAVSHLTNASLADEREAIEITLKLQRKLNNRESTAVALRILEFNMQLARLRYWNDFWLTDLFVPDRAAELKSIK